MLLLLLACGQALLCCHKGDNREGVLCLSGGHHHDSIDSNGCCGGANAEAGLGLFLPGNG